MSKRTAFKNQSEIVLLIESVLNESATSTDFQRLNEIIATDVDARTLYLDYCDMHSALMFQIRSEHASAEAFAKLAETAAITPPSLPAPPIGEPDASNPVPGSQISLLSPIPLTAIVTASVVTLAFASLLYFNGWMSPASISGLDTSKSNLRGNDNHVVDKNATAAMLTGMVDCVWDADARQHEIAAPLRNGSTLSLQSGLIQVTFESGAKMIVEGPAQFTLVSNMEADFQVGRMTSYCPPSAHGFTVQTPEATVVDLGTEFGVDVANDGKTEVHVFSGEVVSWNKNPQASKIREKVHLTKNHSVSFEAGQTLKVVEIDIEKYVRSIDERLDEDELPELPVKRELVLWLAADKQVKTDDKDGVLVWQDLVAGDNQHFDNAWQFVKLWRPKLIPDGIGGLPAVRFNGRSSYLMTTPLATTNDQTVFIVFSFADRATQRLTGGQLLNYNGPPHRYLMRSGAAGVLQIGDLASTRNELQKPGFLRGHVFSGFRNGNPVDAGEIFSNSVIDERRGTLCTYRYSYKEGESELFVNGESQAIASAPTPIEVTSRKVIGRHGAQNFFFYGDISELLIFNDALTEAEMSSVSDYLADRYALDMKGN